MAVRMILSLPKLVRTFVLYSNNVCYISGQNTTALLLWGWDGAILMQAYHCVFAIGTFVSPWIAAPFILPDKDVKLNETTSTTTSSENINSSVLSNYTGLDTLQVPAEKSQVQYVFLIIGIYFLSASVAFWTTYVIWFKYGAVPDSRDGTNKKPNETSSNQNASLLEPSWFRIPMMIFMFFRFGTYCGLEITYTSFLMIFSVEGLNWMKTDGLAVTAAFRASFAAARGVSIFLAAFVSPTKMVLKDLFILVVTYIVLTSFVHGSQYILWICSCAVGFGMGSFYASSMSWVDGNMLITGRAGSTFVTGSWMGVLTMPALVGYLFDTVGPEGFIYFCLVDSLLLAGMCATAMTFSHYYHHKWSKRENCSD